MTRKICNVHQAILFWVVLHHSGSSNVVLV
uniref:Uncharacterized protein n=1 Tax=Lepeophtheirus salmonis TaxID=72036 RepID=A0A0K2T7X9_LEPSM